LVYGIGKERLRWRLFVLVGLILLCTGAVLFGTSPWWLPGVFLAIQYAPDNPSPADAILIEGWVFHEGLISLTADLYRQGYGKLVFATGERFERLQGLIGMDTWADATKKELTALGVPDQDIIAVAQTLEGTHGSALAARAELQRHGIHSLLIITEPLHLLRTCQTYRKATRELALRISCLTLQPARMTPDNWWRSRSGWAMMAREYAALAYYGMKGYL
jgi:uncharacterized SAM-binding protein YcdF (DUF218 family)